MTSCSSRAIRLRSSATARDALCCPVQPTLLDVQDGHAHQGTDEPRDDERREPDEHEHPLGDGGVSAGSGRASTRPASRRHRRTSPHHDRRGSSLRATVYTATAVGRRTPFALRRANHRELHCADQDDPSKNRQRVHPAPYQQRRGHGIQQRLDPGRALEMGRADPPPHLELSERPHDQGNPDVERPVPTRHPPNVLRWHALASSSRMMPRSAVGRTRSRTRARRPAQRRVPTVEHDQHTSGGIMNTIPSKGRRRAPGLRDRDHDRLRRSRRPGRGLRAGHRRRLRRPPSLPDSDGVLVRRRTLRVGAGPVRSRAAPARRRPVGETALGPGDRRRRHECHRRLRRRRAGRRGGRGWRRPCRGAYRSRSSTRSARSRTC